MRAPTQRGVVSVQHSPAMSDKQLVKMRYAEVVSLNAGIGTSASWLFRANSIFDPDYSGVGHQPMGHDEWATFYGHYVVSKSTISVRPIMRAGATDGVVLGLSTVGTNGLAGTAIPVTRMIEQGRCTYQVLGPSTGAFGNAPSGTLWASYDPRKFFGIKDVSDAQVGTQLKAPFGSNPDEDVFFQIFTEATVGTADPGAIECLVVIDYTCLLTEPLPLGQS